MLWMNVLLAKCTKRWWNIVEILQISETISQDITQSLSNELFLALAGHINKDFTIATALCLSLLKLCLVLQQVRRFLVQLEHFWSVLSYLSKYCIVSELCTTKYYHIKSNPELKWINSGNQWLYPAIDIYFLD